MKILALETSAKAVSAAVTEDYRVLCSGYQDSGLTHSRTLMPVIESMLKNAELTLSEMDAIAVAAGPGSFTGIRIGMAAAKGLAFGADKPLIGVSTLAAMTRNAACIDGLIIAAMDARRKQIYNAVFQAQDGELTRLTPDRAIALSDLAQELQTQFLFNRKVLPDEQEQRGRMKITVLGDGGALCLNALREYGIQCQLAPPLLLMQNAVSVALEAGTLAEEILKTQGKLPDPQDILPVYLRPPQAERLRSYANP